MKLDQAIKIAELKKDLVLSHAEKEDGSVVIVTTTGSKMMVKKNKEVVLMSGQPVANAQEPMTQEEAAALIDRNKQLEKNLDNANDNILGLEAEVEAYKEKLNTANKELAKAKQKIVKLEDEVKALKDKASK